MPNDIIIALLSLVGSLAGTVTGILSTARLSNYRIQQLEKKVDKHNNLVERVYLIEQQKAVLENKIEVADHRIADLENERRN